MKKDAIPREFPVGRLRGLLYGISASGRARASSPFLSKPQLISPFGGPVQKYRNLSGLDRDRQLLSAQADGTLSQIVAAKSAPRSLRSNGPELGTGSPPIDMADINVQKGTGNVRDANVQKAAAAKPVKKMDPRLLAIDPSEQHLLPALSIQSGMSQTRKLMWKHMDKNERSRYLLRKAVQQSPV